MRIFGCCTACASAENRCARRVRACSANEQVNELLRRRDYAAISPGNANGVLIPRSRLRFDIIQSVRHVRNSKAAVKRATTFDPIWRLSFTYTSSRSHVHRYRVSDSCLSPHRVWCAFLFANFKFSRTTINERPVSLPNIIRLYTLQLDTYVPMSYTHRVVSDH